MEKVANFNLLLKNFFPLEVMKVGKVKLRASGLVLEPPHELDLGPF